MRTLCTVYIIIRLLASSAVFWMWPALMKSSFYNNPLNINSFMRDMASPIILYICQNALKHARDDTYSELCATLQCNCIREVDSEPLYRRDRMYDL